MVKEKLIEVKLERDNKQDQHLTGIRRPQELQDLGIFNPKENELRSNGF
jgi:hypothetical protein